MSSTSEQSNRGYLFDSFLVVLRLFAGGALLLAASIKLQSPNSLMLSMKSFELVPEMIIPLSSFVLPWMELIVGLALVLGVFTREAGAWAAILYSIFTFAIASVIFRNMSVQCGCFGSLLGGGTIGYHSVIRNLLFVTASVYLVWKGPGRFALDTYLPRSFRTIFPQEKPQPEAGSAPATEA